MNALPSRLHRSQHLALLVLLVLCGEAIGFAVPWLLGVGHTVATALLAVMAAVAVAVAAWVALSGTAPDAAPAPLPDPATLALEQTLATRTEQQRRLRHDIRGALSPIMLTADRLVKHADPAVKRSGEILLRSVDRATAVLGESGDGVSPPDDP